jgi:hypothetical protein
MALGSILRGLCEKRADLLRWHASECFVQAVLSTDADWMEGDLAISLASFRYHNLFPLSSNRLSSHVFCKLRNVFVRGEPTTVC